MAPPRRLLPAALFVALALVVAVGPGVVGAAGADVAALGPTDAAVDQRTNTTGQASPDSVTQRGYARADVDVAGAVSVGAARLEGRHEALTFTTRLDRAETDDERASAVNATLDDVRANLDRLDARHAQLVAAHGEGALTDDAFLRRLAVIEAAADRQRTLLGEADTRTRAAGLTSLPVSVQTRIARLQADTVVLPNPVAERTVRAVGGTGPARTLYVESGATGLVTATVADGTHHRVATLRDQRRPDAPDQFGADVGVAFERAEELYPWLFENAIGSPSARGFGFTSVYLIQASHPQGEFRAYIDGATRTTFHEIQSKEPEAVPLTGNRTAVGDDLAVRVETTYPGGPMRVTVTRPNTGLGSEAAVRVNGQRVGTTGPGGTLVTVQPAGGFTVNATVPGASGVEVDGP